MIRNSIFDLEGTYDCTPFSSFHFFDFTDEYVKAGGNYNRPARQICSLMRAADAKTLVIEKLKECGENLDGELEAIQKAVGYAADHYDAYRCSFFLCEKRDYDNGLVHFQEDFLGYFTVLNVSYKWRHSFSYILEAILKPPKFINGENEPGAMADPSDHYYHSVRDFDINIADHGAQTVRGSYFCQQNGLTHVCAHSALCTMLVNSGVIEPREAAPELLKKKIGDFYPSWEAEIRGPRVNPHDILNLLQTHYSLTSVVFNAIQRPEDNYVEFLHWAIEKLLYSFECPTGGFSPISHMEKVTRL